MRSHKKSVKEKLATKLLKLTQMKGVTRTRNEIKVFGETFATIRPTEIVYKNKRYSPKFADPIREEQFNVTIKLTHDTLPLLNTNLCNPPIGASKVYDIFKEIYEEVDQVVIGGKNDYVVATASVSVSTDFYQYLLKVFTEEAKAKSVAVFNRMVPLIQKHFDSEVETKESTRNYSLLLQEIIASGELSQEDLIKLAEKLDGRESSSIVIETQIIKQVEWLLGELEDILALDQLTTMKAKNIGLSKFNYSKSIITGPENLMEKILTDFGQHALFGVPALINTKKYVLHPGRSRAQFDLILVNHLGDIELVELKRPDKHLLEFGDGRGKFYPSKDLAIAIAQLERYLTAAQKDHDREYLIDGKTIREYINGEIGDDLYAESIRPRGLIIMGSWSKLCLPYSGLNDQQKRKIKKSDYDDDSFQAFKELKNSLKNITIMTYSELLEIARTRLNISARQVQEE